MHRFRCTVPRHACALGVCSDLLHTPYHGDTFLGRAARVCWYLLFLVSLRWPPVLPGSACVLMFVGGPIHLVKQGRGSR